MLYRIRQKIRGIKFSPIACPLNWGKIFAKFNFANRLRSTLQEVVGGGQAYRIMRMRIRSLVPSPPPLAVLFVLLATIAAVEAWERG